MERMINPAVLGVGFGTAASGKHTHSAGDWLTKINPGIGGEQVAAGGIVRS